MGGQNSKVRSFLRTLDIEDGLTEDQFKRSWELFDLNANGILEHEEAIAFFKAYAKAKGIEDADGAAKAFFSRFDYNGDGKIEYAELMMPQAKSFLASLNLDFGFSEQQFQQVWQLYDTNKNGVLDKDEALRFFVDLAKSKKWGRVNELAEEFFQRFDTNGDGHISYEELIAEEDEETVRVSMAMHGKAMEQRAAKEGDVFEIRVERPFGFRINESKWGAFVSHVAKEGNAATWNVSNPTAQLRVGDFLVSVKLKNNLIGFDGASHKDVGAVIKALGKGAMQLTLRRANSDQDHYLQQWLANNEKAAVGEKYTVTLPKPFGFRLQPSEWGASIEHVRPDGSVHHWNTLNSRRGTHIQLGDFVVGKLDEDKKVMFDNAPAAVEFLKNTKEPTMTLILRRRTLYQQRALMQQRQGGDAVLTTPPFEVTLAQPFGFNINDSKWGPFICVMKETGSAADWNKTSNQVIEVGDFLDNVQIHGKMVTFTGCSHKEIGVILKGLVKQKTIVLGLRKGSMEQRADIRNWLKHTEESAVGEQFTVTLNKPFGINLEPSPWGASIAKIRADGSVHQWNRHYTLRGGHIQPGDLILGHIDKDYHTQLFKTPEACTEYLRTTKERSVTLVLQRRTWFQHNALEHCDHTPM